MGDWNGEMRSSLRGSIWVKWDLGQGIMSGERRKLYEVDGKWRVVRGGRRCCDLVGRAMPFSAISWIDRGRACFHKGRW